MKIKFAYWKACFLSLLTVKKTCLRWQNNLASLDWSANTIANILSSRKSEHHGWGCLKLNGWNCVLGPELSTVVLRPTLTMAENCDQKLTPQFLNRHRARGWKVAWKTNLDRSQFFSVKLVIKVGPQLFKFTFFWKVDLLGVKLIIALLSSLLSCHKTTSSNCLN